jgi:hypothetical protein
MIIGSRILLAVVAVTVTRNCGSGSRDTYLYFFFKKKLTTLEILYSLKYIHIA